MLMKNRSRAIVKRYFEALNILSVREVSYERRQIVEEEALINSKWICRNEAEDAEACGKNPFDCAADERFLFDVLRGLTYPEDVDNPEWRVAEHRAWIAVKRHFREFGVELSDRQIENALKKTFERINQFDSSPAPSAFRLRSLEDVRKQLVSWNDS